MSSNLIDFLVKEGFKFVVLEDDDIVIYGENNNIELVGTTKGNYSLFQKEKYLGTIPKNKLIEKLRKVKEVM